jgi:hypothetical protein
MKRNVKIFFVIVFFMFFIENQVVADPFISYPGTRARAMGGAFTAIAEDASAVWYNPAGVAGGSEIDFVFEWSQAISRKLDVDIENDIDTLKGNEVGELNNDKNKIFLGISWEDQKWGGGFFYLSPYTINWYFPPKHQLGTAFGEIEEDMHIVGLAGARSLLNDRLKIGVSLEYVLIKYDDDKLRYIYDYSGGSYWYKKANSDMDANAFSGSIGVLATPINYKPLALKVKIGGVYRFQSSASPATEKDETATHVEEVITDQLVFNKPASYDIGISFTKGFTAIKSQFTFSAQYGFTDWSKANDYLENDYSKTSFGAEWQILQKLAIFDAISFRGGFYESVASKTDEGWPDVQGYTLGIGTRVGGKWGGEFTYEYRTLSFAQKEDDDSFPILSFALTYSF